jgi:hypothetical protein
LYDAVNELLRGSFPLTVLCHNHDKGWVARTIGAGPVDVVDDPLDTLVAIEDVEAVVDADESFRMADDGPTDDEVDGVVSVEVEGNGVTGSKFDEDTIDSDMTIAGRVLGKFVLSSILGLLVLLVLVLASDAAAARSDGDKVMDSTIGANGILLLLLFTLLLLFVSIVNASAEGNENVVANNVDDELSIGVNDCGTLDVDGNDDPRAFGVLLLLMPAATSVSGGVDDDDDRFRGGRAIVGMVVFGMDDDVSDGVVVAPEVRREAGGVEVGLGSIATVAAASDDGKCSRNTRWITNKSFGNIHNGSIPLPLLPSSGSSSIAITTFRSSVIGKDSLSFMKCCSSGSTSIT